ncbi:MAG: hypothetical protein LWY06_15465, partial [Firmicutes bacterium]|nr:hypothetical protein [Bacillota bacterium]
MDLLQNRYYVYIDENGSELSETSLRNNNNHLCLAAICLTYSQAQRLRDIINELKLIYWRNEDDFRCFHYEEFRRENYPEIFGHPDGIDGFRRRFNEIFSSIEMKIFYSFLDQKHYYSDKSAYDNKLPYYFLLEKLLIAMHSHLKNTGYIDRIYIEERDSGHNKSLKNEIQKEFLSKIAKQDNSYYQFFNLERNTNGESCEVNKELLYFKHK